MLVIEEPFALASRVQSHKIEDNFVYIAGEFDEILTAAAELSICPFHCSHTHNNVSAMAKWQNGMEIVMAQFGAEHICVTIYATCAPKIGWAQ